MSRDDEPPPARRRFLAQGAAAAAAALAGGPARAEEAAPPAVPEWMKIPGADVGSQTYGRPSRFEDGVIRNVPQGLKQYISASSRTPLQDLDGILTPNGLFYERHHGGIPDIDPARHRLMIHGLVETPLILTMEDIRRFPSESHIYFLECSGNPGFEAIKGGRRRISSVSSAAPNGRACASRPCWRRLGSSRTRGGSWPRARTRPR